MTLRSLVALAVLAFAPAALAEDKPAVDLVASIFGGIGDGASAIIGEEMYFTRTAPGRFEGRTVNSEISTLTVDETTPCVFDMTYSFKGAVFPVRIDFGLVRSITFTPGDLAVGVLAPIRTYEVRLEGEEGLAVRLLPEGQTTPLDHSPPIATAIPVADLEAAAARLKALCPTR